MSFCAVAAAPKHIIDSYRWIGFEASILNFVFWWGEKRGEEEEEEANNSNNNKNHHGGIDSPAALENVYAFCVRMYVVEKPYAFFHIIFICLSFL